MAPVIFLGATNVLRSAASHPHNPFPGVRQQWQNPNDLFSVLLIVGGDIIQRAIAQLCSPYHFTPVAFSFGWVSYAASAITSAIGDGKLMPEPDCPSTITNTRSGYARNNGSWVLGRILRDWPDEDLRDENGRDYSLVVTTCKQLSAGAGQPTLDMVWWFGVFTIIAQNLISIIPGVRDGVWTVFVVTAGGTLACLMQSALPQWAKEKLNCRRIQGDKVQRVVLTKGNGHNHVLVITTEAGGLNLEDLASGRVNKHRTTLPLTLALSILWLIILLTAIAVQDHTWYLLLVGSIGMAQNIFAAGYKRKPEAFGVHLTDIQSIGPKEAGSPKVIKVIQKVEEEFEGLGLALLPTFFPGDLFPHEKAWRDETMARIKAKKEADKDAVQVQTTKTA